MKWGESPASMIKRLMNIETISKLWGQAMTLDDYTCDGCKGEFLVRDGAEPNACPFCQSPELSWSHEVKSI